VARRIVAHTGLAPPALVLEAGAGDGLLTEALAARAGRVIAVERDRSLWLRLRERFVGCETVSPILDDIRHVPLPRKPYVFVANPPFHLTAELLRLILLGPRKPMAAFLVLERDAALHWSGAGRSSVVSVLAGVDWEMDIPLALRRSDFVLRPRVDCVLLAARRRGRPLVAPSERVAFEAFVRTGFGRGRRDARTNLRGLMPEGALLGALRSRGFAKDALPSELGMEAWVELFRRARPTPPIRRGP
jgi:16S rRNA A1518/A1519 N6-dimethyltransferase RsmA/KsgA/DIM1 with predicted DNA glycosylase/AP lyase activity